MIVVLACLLLVIVGGGSLVAATVKASIESMDRDVLGVDVTINSLEVSLHKGLIDMKGMVVANASGYSAEYLLNVDRALVDVDMCTMIRTGFKEIVVQGIVMSNVDVIWEKSGMTQSNIKQVLNHVTARREKAQQAQSSAGSEPSAGNAPAPPRRKSARTIRVEKVRFDDIGVKMASHLLQGAGMRLSVADIDYDDFSADHGSCIIDDVAAILVMSLLKSVVASTAGKSIGDHFF